MKPRVGAFIHPASGFGMRMPFAFFDLFATRFDVWIIMASQQDSSKIFRLVGLIGTQVLFASRPGLGTTNRQTVERRNRQLDVVPVRRSGGQAQHHAASVGEYGPFDAQFSSIGWIWPGFFPLREGLL